MASEVYTAVVRPASNFSTEKKKGSSAPLGAAGVAALGALTASSTVAEVLDILSTVQKADHVVAPNQIGRATSVLT